MPIIGADFLRHFGLLVDLGEMRLMARGGGWSQHLVEPSGSGTFATIGVIADKQPTTPSLPTVEARGSSSPVQHVEPTTPSLPTVEARGSSSPLQHLLEEFPSVLNKSKVLPAPTHCVQHFLITEGRPATAKYRRLDNERLEAAKKEFAELEKQGIIRRSSSNWASPLHMVKKADGTWRPCGDYRQLNLQTKPDLYTCPNIADLTARLEGCTIFSKLDLRKGFHQIPVRPCDVPKTAVITPFGLWEFIRMSFGLRNAGQSFQRMMDEVLDGLDFCFVYVDDVLIGSKSEEEHVQHIREVLSRLEQHGIVLNGEKCVLGVPEVQFLGHLVSARGITPLPEKVAAIRAFPQPVTVGQLMSYLGMVNFYRRFIRGAAGVLKPLTDRRQSGQGGVVHANAAGF